MPLDPVNDFEGCVLEFKEKGDDEQTARKRCGAIKADQEVANASILKKHTADLPCMCEMLQTATADFFTKDGSNYASFFLLNDQMNLKKWAVTADSMPKYLKSFIGKPFISEPELAHFGADDLPIHEVVSKQEDYRVGDIVEVKLDTKTQTAEAIVKFHKTAEAEAIWNEMQKGNAIYVSPAIAGYSVNSAEGSTFYEWYGLHLARVGNPAYGVFHASLKKTCTGDERTCINTLVASAMANTSFLEKTTSNNTSFKANGQSKIKMANESETKGKTDVDELQKLKEENASLTKELASIKTKSAQLEEVASEVTTLKEALVQKEEEEKQEIVQEIMTLKEQVGVETEPEAVEEETASMMKKSLASLKEQKSLLTTVQASVASRLSEVEARSSSRIIRTPETASASAEKKVIDMKYIKELTA